MDAMKWTGIEMLDIWLTDLESPSRAQMWLTVHTAADILEIQARYPELIPLLAAAKDSDFKDANVRAALRKTVEELIELDEDSVDIYEEV